MCGIALLIDKNGSGEKMPVLKNMVNVIKHRGPDGEGFFEHGNLGMGHRRLAIIDLSEAAHQPYQFEHLTVSYNGEVYNYPELRQELTKAGYEFSSQSDVEVLIKSWHYWGENCQHRFRGMWAFIIHDANLNMIYLCRDRFGIKPLEYYSNNDWFAAGSEAKQFLHLPGFVPEMNQGVVHDFLRYGILHHTAFTFYKHVRKVLPGHTLKYNLSTNQFSIDKWYHLKVAKSEGNIPSLFRQKFEDSVKIHLRSDVSLGFCLSGGMDSSAIVCMGRKLLGNEAEMHTITSCNNLSSFDEREFAEAVVEHCNTKPHYIYPDLSRLYEGELLEEIVWYHDGPVASGSHFSEYTVFNQAAKEGLKVMLDGQGSDEYLAGYDWYFTYWGMHLLKTGRLYKLFTSISQRAAFRKKSKLNLLKEIIYTTFFRGSKGGDNAIPAWMNAAWVREQNEDRGKMPKELKDIRTMRELSYWEITEASLPYNLHSEDRNSMRFSIESRVPFLDHLLVESIYGLKPETYFNGGIDKMPLRTGLEDIFPEKILNRRTKFGFASSDEIWMNDNAVIIREKLASAADRFSDILNKDNLLGLFDEFILGKTPYNAIFFRVISLHAWCNRCGIVND